MKNLTYRERSGNQLTLSPREREGGESIHLQIVFLISSVRDAAELRNLVTSLNGQ